jgi:hypothetical protein
LDGVASELQELMFITEEYGCGSLLVIAAVTWVEHFNTKLSLLINLFGSYGESESSRKYPDAPVPKSIAMTCVKMLSSLSKAIFKL